MLHYGEEVWHLTNISINENNITGKITDFLGHDYYKTTAKDRVVNRFEKNKYYKNTQTLVSRPTRYKKRTESDVLNEIHIYLTGLLKLKEMRIS